MKFHCSEIIIYPYKFTMQSCIQYCYHVWAGPPSCYLDVLDKLQKRVYRSVGHLLVRLTHCQNAQPANVCPQDVLRTSSSNIPRTSPKDSIWPSRGRPEMTSWGRPNLTSKGRPNLTPKGRLWGLVSGPPQDVFRTSPRQPWKQIIGRCEFICWMPPNLFLLFFSELLELLELSEQLAKSI